ncbi:hypothetical protein I5M27_02925 [Adhaeribacter sp. BT258]|uniref:Thymidylate kinase n=1 Tax=Adhaeribacter terrigena TaxID=2793070 RepID=A0ABS1BXP4_9BACT|nr:hypothetical protein [Adhaeribacter terrigena]MBK0401921.1 hypothetical protein [Adhaeribacter terrigena]
MDQFITKPAVTLPLVKNLVAAWHENNILYCHWKSNEHLAASMTGDTDLDVLFDENQKEKTIEILHELGFKRFHSISQKEYKDIEDFLGLDLESGKVIHVHAHFRLTMGEMYLKGYQLNFENKILETRYFNETFGIYCSSPAFELVLLYIREALKLRHRDQGLMYVFNKIKYTGNTQTEYEWLRKQAKNEDIERILKGIFQNYEPIYQFITGSFNRRELFKLADLIRNEFRDNRLHSPLEALVLRWYREVTVKVSRKLARLLNQPILAQRINPRGGMVVAVIGADGSGKSTVTANLQATFRQKLDVYRIYYGRGDGRISFPRKVLQAFKKTAKPKAASKESQVKNGRVSGKKSGLVANIYQCLEALLVAHEKSSNLNRMQKARAKGMLVICDRFPQNQLMGYNDGPLLHHLRNSGNPIFKRIAAYEARVYARAENTPPDAIIKLIADAEVVEARKPGETSLEKLETKIAGIKKLQFGKSCKTITIDATQPLQQVLTSVKQNIWENCP